MFERHDVGHRDAIMMLMLFVLQETTDKSAELRSACGDYDVFAQVDYEPHYT